MKAVIQRVKSAMVEIDGKIKAEIKQGLLVLVGIAADDTESDANWLVQKICQLRIFSDENNKINLSIKDIGGEILLVSQFTLFASTKKGNRPSFSAAARPEIAIPLYQKTVQLFENEISTKTGTFGADMQVSLCNDGPITLILDTENKI